MKKVHKTSILDVMPLHLFLMILYWLQAERDRMVLDIKVKLQV